MRRLNLPASIVSFVVVLCISIGVAAAGLVKYQVKDGAIAASLTGKPGDPVKGKKVATNRKKGNCLACHKMPIPEQSFHGNIGPDLTGVGGRLNVSQLRLRVVDSKRVNPDTSMPAYYRTDKLHRVMKKWVGKTILSPEQIEDLVAYLATLK